jgi:hypothetical protein
VNALEAPSKTSDGARQSARNVPRPPLRTEKRCFRSRSLFQGIPAAVRRTFLGLVACLMAANALAQIQGDALLDPRADAYNIRLGTQTFGPKYRLTTNTVLVETAEAIRGMGSDVLKFYLGKGLGGQYPGLTVPASATSLATLARNEPSCRRVLDMPFRHVLIWSYCFSAGSDASWSDGFSTTERQKEYAEIYDFTRYLLTNYNASGKSFYLGHWEGDWYLLPNYNTAINPSPTAIQGMIGWLNTRQQAVDDAMRDVAHTNVAVYHYTEVNRVRDAMVNGATNNQRLVNKVLPAVTNLDFVSWSSYDGMNLDKATLQATLNYIEAQLPTNKAASIPGRRVIIGEYGWGGSNTSAEQEPLTRAYLQKLLPWSPRFILFWEMYDNESKAYWLIDSAGTKTPCYELHQRFANVARLQVARFLETQNRLPTDAEFSSLTVTQFTRRLTEPARFTLEPQSLIAVTGPVATVSATLTQGIYGDDLALMRVFWGPQDGGTQAVHWAHSVVAGTNRQFAPSAWTVRITNAVPGDTFYFRWQATNRNGAAWGSNSIPFRFGNLRLEDYGSRLRLGLEGYVRPTPLTNFPVLVQLGPHLPGFDYRQFASPAGGDLRFADASGTVSLPHEIDEWNTNGTSFVWVRVPELSASRTLWAMWGNPLETNRPASDTNGAVWSQGFELVWHLRESAFPRADSALLHPATSGVNPSSIAEGAVGRASMFNGASTFLDAGPVALGDAFTLSAWIKPDTEATSIQSLWANKPGGSVSNGVAFFLNSWQTRDGKLIVETGNGTSGALTATPTHAVATDGWHHVAASINRSGWSALILVDGQIVAQGGAQSNFGNTAALLLGRFSDGLYAYKGGMDEVRVERQARSADWLWASWMTVASNRVLQSYAAVDRQRPPVAWRAAAPGVSMAWPAFATGYHLVTTTSLREPILWQPVTNLPVLEGQTWQVQLPATPEQSRFFRLESL